VFVKCTNFMWADLAEVYTVNVPRDSEPTYDTLLP
jgi:hypothetical protein